MNERGQGALMLAVGGVAIRLGLSGAALNYIKDTYVPLLVVAGVITAVLGAAVLKRGLTADRDAHGHDAGADDHQHDGDLHAGHDHGHDADHPVDDDRVPALAAREAEDVHGHADDGSGHGHSHDTAPRVAWFLAAPLFAVLLIAPPPLGSFAAGRQSGIVAQPTAAWPELPAEEAGAVPLGLGDYASRAIYDTDLSLSGETVRLTGFVSEITTDGFLLTRFALSCCAADGTAINVRVVSTTPPPAIDEWVEVTGTWTPIDGHIIGELTSDPPILEAQQLRPVPQPDQPYET